MRITIIPQVSKLNTLSDSLKIQDFSFIKKEEDETKLPWHLIEEDSKTLESSKSGIKTQCTICTEMIAEDIMDDHWESFHRFDLTTNPNRIPPFMDGPDFYCSSCQIHYLSRPRYCYHLRSVHKMVTSSTSQYNIHQEIKPDKDDPNHYCKSCEKNYKNQRNYHRHLEHIHKMDFLSKTRVKRIRQNPEVRSDINHPAHHCNKCNKTYANRRSYRNHLRVKHAMTIGSEIVILHAGTIPDIDNSNNYCLVCQKKFSDRQRYLLHLSSSYGIDINKFKRKPKRDILPDLNDPRLFCITCEKKYSTKSQYQNHLRLIHNIYLLKLKVPPNEIQSCGKEPDIKDPNNYCSACNYRYRSKETYKSHLIYTHSITE